MNKLFTKIVGMAIGLTISIGVNIAVASSNKEVGPAEAAVIGTHLQQVTSLTSGSQYVIVGNNNGYALPTNPTVSSGKVAGTPIANVPNNGAGYLWTITQSGNYWLIGDGSKYIYHANGGNSGTNLAYGTSQASYPWSLTYSTSGQNHWTFAGVVASTSTVKSRGMLCHDTNFGGYALSNEGSYKYMNIYKVKTLSSIAVSGATTSFTVGDTFSFGGTVTATYSDSSTADVTSSATFSGYNMSTVGNQTVTVTYTTVQTTYSITVSPFVGYNKVTNTEDLVVGESYVVGVENNTKGKELMSNVSGSGTSVYRTRVDGSAAFNNEKTRVSQSKASIAGAVVVTLLSDGDGKYALYDISNNKYIAGDNSSNYAADYDSLSAAGDNAWWTIEFANSLMSMTLNSSTRVFGYNLSSPGFSTYASYVADSTTATSGTAHPVFFKMAGSTVKTNVTAFVNTSLKMNDSNYEGDIETENCASNYNAMKTAYAALSDAEKNVFQYSSDYAAARARLLNWAKANGETFTYGSATPFATTRNVIVLNIAQNGNIEAIIVIISMISITTIGGYFFLRKRKEQ